jgi:hypothetical protein
MPDSHKRLRICEAPGLRREIRTLEHKRHNLNAAIEAANLTNTVHLGGDEVTLAKPRRGR